MINVKEQQKAAKEFAKRWEGRGYEKGESNLFWIDLLTHVYGVDNIAEFISFEDQVHLDHTSFIDGYIESTHVMIEQKSIGKDLRKEIKQSDKTYLTPFQQAKRYSSELPYSKRPRWIITCNFAEFLVYDMEKPNGEPEQIFLKDLGKDYYRLQFLVKTGSENLKREMEISLKAGELVGKLYDAILKQYKNPNDPHTLKSLNMLCVRLVFCLYAEDAGIFGQHEMFGQYLAKFPVGEVRKKLIELFEVLDTKPEDRDPYMDDDLAAFPYVNGGLFADENIEIPRFTDEIVDLLIHNASEGFDWSEISPTIFGAVFESTLNPETRRSGGMHYTSIENIHKVIDPLFLDDLKAELAEIAQVKVKKTRDQKLEAFREKLSTLVFLDPACGSGNFLTETYISLRKLENKAIDIMQQGQIVMGELNPIKVGISQFYGIEINDFAVTVARTALWIAESQMLHETEELINQNIEFLPLKSYPNITEGNALRIDWESVVPKEKLSYIMGNPPFVGYKFQTPEQKTDIKQVAGSFKNYGTLDYVSAWYIKAAQFMKNTNISATFVSTNSIVQGEHVSTLWQPLMKENLYINFAHRTFRWDSEASLKAHVHCVIIEFSYHSRSKKYLWNESGNKRQVNQINAYLLDAPTVFIDKRSKPWNPDTPIATKGNAAMDNGNLTITAEERADILAKEPGLAPVIKRHMSADDFLNNHENYCFWFDGVDISDYRKSKEIQKRLTAVRDYRNASNRAATKKMAQSPLLFAEIRQPNTNYLMIPVVSSEQRRYIPIAFLPPDIINSYASISVPNATLYHFGILCSNVHNAWMRTVCGRLKSDYRYATSLVYNTFPWCTPTKEQIGTIIKTAQGILDARNNHPTKTLADLYDKDFMPNDLITAHQNNDKAVMQAYGFALKMTESEIVAELMKMYQKLTEK